MDTALGGRVVIVGPSCSGKSTLGTQLAAMLKCPFVELDALFWKPNWEPPSDDEFRERLIAAHAGETWVTVGNYFRHTTPVVWPRAETIIWLDFPRTVTIRRILARSWRRWRSGEVLWGTNTEKFWQQLKVWSPDDSLIAYTLRSHRRHRETMQTAMADTRWSAIRFVRLQSPGRVREFLAGLPRPNGGA